MNEAKPDPFLRLRLDMVEDQIECRGVRDRRVLDAMKKVPRHLFAGGVSPEDAYADYPLPIGRGQTISQPYIVALMTELLEIGKEDRVLEIGTGCGYQSAVLAEICREVFSVERIPELSERASALLAKLGYRNIRFRAGNGYDGWEEYAPYDGILVTAAPQHVPQCLTAQVRDGGHLVIPVGGMTEQVLVVLKKKGERFEERQVCGVRFVRMIDD